MRVDPPIPTLSSSSPLNQRKCRFRREMTDGLKMTPVPMAVDPCCQEAAARGREKKKTANHLLFLAPGVTHMCAHKSSLLGK